MRVSAGFCRDRLVGEDVDPDLAAALDLARHRDTGGLDLAVRDPARARSPSARSRRTGRVVLALREAGAPAAMRLRNFVFFGISIAYDSFGFLGARFGFSSTGGAAAASGVSAGGASFTGFAVSSAGGASVVGFCASGACWSRRGRPPAPAGRAPTGAAAPAAAGTSAAAARAAGPATALPHRAEALTVGTAAAAALARGAETLDRSATTAARVLVAEARVAGLNSFVALRHDLALVDPDLHADAAERRLRLDEAVVDVGAKGVERHAALAVRLAARHLAAAEAAAALDLHAGGARADRGGERRASSRAGTRRGSGAARRPTARRASRRARDA